MPKAHSGGKTIADYGDGGSTPSGRGLGAHGGAPRLSGRMDGPKGPGGATSPASFGGGPTVVSYPSPVIGGGPGAKGESSSAGATTPPSGSAETGF